MAKPRETTWSDLKAELARFDRTGLLGLLKDMYALRPENRAFLAAQLGVGSAPLTPGHLEQWPFLRLRARPDCRIELRRGPFRAFFAPRMPWRGRLTRRWTDPTHATNSSGRSRHPLEMHQSAHVVAQVHHADLEPRPRQADGAHDLAAHRVLLVDEHMLDARAHFRARRVSGLLSFRQRMVACPAPMDAAL